METPCPQPDYRRRSSRRVAVTFCVKLPRWRAWLSKRRDALRIGPCLPARGLASVAHSGDFARPGFAASRAIAASVRRLAPTVGPVRRRVRLRRSLAGRLAVPEPYSASGGPPVPANMHSSALPQPWPPCRSRTAAVPSELPRSGLATAFQLPYLRFAQALFRRNCRACFPTPPRFAAAIGQVEIHGIFQIVGLDRRGRFFPSDKQKLRLLTESRKRKCG